jgi:signal transduction histidine kinase
VVSQNGASALTENLEHEHARRRTAGPILAVSSAGTITKVNLQARRAFGDDAPQEREQLGLFLARLMMGHETSPRQLMLELADGEEPTDVLLVPSDEEPPRGGSSVRESVAGEASSGEPGETTVNVADFIAHELRNNVAITLGLSQLLETNFDSIDPTDRTAALKGIQTEAEQALLVLDGLLKLVESRRKSGAIERNIPLHAVLHKVIADHRRRQPDRLLQVTGDAPVFVTGNSTWIQLAVANLIANAEKVTPPKQPIEVNVRQDADRVLVMVLDQGQALTRPMYQELWDIYSKGAPAGLEISGSGIGLSLCKELVGAMGGHVWAGPRSGGGSAFAITLQAATETSAGGVSSQSQ